MSTQDDQVHSLVQPLLKASPLTPNQYRDVWAVNLASKGLEQAYRVAGWVHKRRDHGGLVFIDVRDRTGIIQTVFNPQICSKHVFEQVETLRPEFVVSISGKLVARTQDTLNPDLPTGGVEMVADGLEILSTAQTPPFSPTHEDEVEELIRLRHRHIDLRRNTIRNPIVLRSLMVSSIRKQMESLGFLDIETPTLTRSTPEGARDFLVPARMQQDAFYALPQSPQLFKQLFMVAGLERYFQIARCFRDEGTRADRQPEFSQLDAEMSFVTQEDIISTFESVMDGAFKTGGFLVDEPEWERITYHEAMQTYGSDRPDRRFGLHIKDISPIFENSTFKVFENTLKAGGKIKAINAGKQTMSRKELDEVTEHIKELGASGLIWMFNEPTGVRSPVAKFFSDGEKASLLQAMDAEIDDLIFVVADGEKTALSTLGWLRLNLAERFDLFGDKNDILWVVDFPMFEWDAREQRFDAMHHPFTKPVYENGEEVDWSNITPQQIGQLQSQAYDLVVNGMEIGGGSMRISTSQEQISVLKVLGFSEQEARERFGFLIDALASGSPPHGGIAFGIERLVATCAGRESIKDVIAFPKTASGGDPLTGAPAQVDAKQLYELGIKTL